MSVSLFPDCKEFGEHFLKDQNLDILLAYGGPERTKRGY